MTRIANTDRAAAGQLLPGWLQFEGVPMKVIVDLCLVPIGVGVHLAPYVAACERVLTEAGLKIQLHPNGTATEGDWGPVFAAIEACHQAVHAMGCARVYSSVSINPAPTGTRPSRTRWPACKRCSDASSGSTRQL
jgi:uncharacterized protein (TIGR00106 family)